MLLAFAGFHTFAVGYHKARYRTRHSTQWSLALEPRFRCLVGLRPVRNLLQESSLFDSWYLERWVHALTGRPLPRLGAMED
jgi:hypothetical protein